MLLLRRVSVALHSTFAVPEFVHNPGPTRTTEHLSVIRYMTRVDLLAGLRVPQPEVGGWADWESPASALS